MSVQPASALPQAARAAPAPASARALLLRDVALGSVLLLILGWLTLMTPAFTDYEAESEPAIQALLAGHLAHGLQLLPIYGGSVILETPFGLLSHLLDPAGFVSLYRSIALPGAILTIVVAHWGAKRLRTLTPSLGAWVAAAVVVIICASPAIDQGWTLGHPEELLVTGLALLGIIARVSGRNVLGAALLGFAAAGKPWASLVLFAGLASSSSWRQFARDGAVAAACAALLLLPVALGLGSHLSTGLADTGGGLIFKPGQLWWFLGRHNPDWVGAAANRHRAGDVAQLFTSANSARFAPSLVGTWAHKLIIVGGAAAVLVWARVTPAAARRSAALLFTLVAALLWWRCLLDPWYQGYYAMGALAATALAAAAGGRPPALAGAAWTVMWLSYGQNAPLWPHQPDLETLITYAWLVPTTLLLTARAFGLLELGNRWTTRASTRDTSSSNRNSFESASS